MGGGDDLQPQLSGELPKSLYQTIYGVWMQSSVEFINYKQSANVVISLLAPESMK